MTGPEGATADEAQELAQRVAAVVTATPGVAGLDGGVFGAIATYLPGRRLTGVRVGGAGEPVEVGIVVTFGRPIPETVGAVRRAVAAMVAPGTEVDITVGDIATGDTISGDTTTGPVETTASVVVDVDGAAAAGSRRRVL